MTWATKSQWSRLAARALNLSRLAVNCSRDAAGFKNAERTVPARTFSKGDTNLEKKGGNFWRSSPRFPHRRPGFQVLKAQRELLMPAACASPLAVFAKTQKARSPLQATEVDQRFCEKRSRQEAARTRRRSPGEKRFCTRGRTRPSGSRR